MTNNNHEEEDEVEECIFLQRARNFDPLKIGLQ